MRGHLPRRHYQRGFTLVELVVVIAIVGIVVAVAGFRFGAFDYWKEENTLRRLSETLILLNQQAVMDQEFYRIEFDFESNSYRVGIMKGESSVSTSVAGTAGAGYLSDELAAFLSPGLEGDQTMIPPPSFPTLAEPQPLPGRMRLTEVRTPRGLEKVDDAGDKPFLLFSPRGFSEFGVIHVTMGDDQPVTIFVNPWTGLTEIYREYKDFQWTLGQRNQNS